MRGGRGIDCAKQPRAQLESMQSLPPGCHVVSKALSSQHTCTHTHTHTPGNSTNSPSLFPLRPLSPCRAADATVGEVQRQQRLTARREANPLRAAARRQLPREQQAAAAGTLQQQVDEYLASFDPEKPLYHGWGMGDAGELPAEATVDAKPLLCRVLGAVVHGWECSDPALYV